jgi:hypothetical protein
MFATTDVRFLDSPIVYRAELPTAVNEQMPEMSIGFALGPGENILSYAPREQIVDPAKNPALKHLQDATRGEFSVSMFETVEAPSVLFVYWHLPDGYLVTYMEAPIPEYPDALGLGGVNSLLSGVSIDVSEGWPLVGWSAPIHGADLREIDRRPQATFVPTKFFSGGGNSSAWPIVRFRKEPPWIRERSVYTIFGSADEPWVEVGVTTPEVKVSCEGPGSEMENLKGMATHIAESLERVGWATVARARISR